MKMEHIILLGAGALLLMKRASATGNATSPAPSSLPTMDDLQAAVGQARNAYSDALAAAVAPYQSQLESIPYGNRESYGAAATALQQATQAFATTDLGTSLKANITAASDAVRALPGQQLAARGIAVASTGDWSGVVAPSNWSNLPGNVQQELLSGHYTLFSGSRWW